MAKNGLTPMGKYLSRETSDKLRLWDKNTKEAGKRLKPALFSVLTHDSNWLQKGYITPRAEMDFDNEHDAMEYISRWHKNNTGTARLLTPTINERIDHEI